MTSDRNVLERARVLGVAAALLGACLLTACLGDPAPGPAEAPLEVVLDGCGLNRTEVAAGRHDVATVGEGRLVITDDAGEEVLSAPGGGGILVTTEGTYTFTCTVGSTVTTSVLRSVHAEQGD